MELDTRDYGSVADNYTAEESRDRFFGRGLCSLSWLRQLTERSTEEETPIAPAGCEWVFVCVCVRNLDS